MKEQRLEKRKFFLNQSFVWMIKWFESVIVWMFPTILVDGTPWHRMWEEKDKESFLLVSRFFFPLASIAYIGHYFFYDIPNNLEPIEDWMAFRIFMASFSFATFMFYISSFTRIGWYRLPAILTCWLICVSQAYVALVHGLESWVFCYILIALTALSLRMSAFKSSLFVVVTVLSQAPILLEAGIPVSYIFTGFVVTMVFTLVVRSSLLSEVKSFLLNQENIAAQKKIIELNLDFSERLRSFIPRVIAQRLENYVEHERMTVLEASIEVLAPRKIDVACLFSDIRGYTQGSKELDEFISQSVIPEVKACSDAIEDLQGIPRKIGDLIFAYFDDQSIETNLLRAVVGGMRIARLNHDMNATMSSVNIRRYVLISCGEAVVGNIGGLDSSIEITALGSPVNYLNRVDELTKDEKIKKQLESGDLVLCERSSSLLNRIAPGINQTRIELCGLNIRDFPEVRSIYSVKPTDANHAAANDAYRQNREQKNGIPGKNRRFAT